MATADTRSRFVFTGHDGAVICGYEPSAVRVSAFRYVANHCDAAVALSHAEAGYLKAVTRSRTEVRIIPNGIRADVYGAAPSGEPEPELPELLYVGQLIPLKGVDTLLRALHLLKGKRRFRLRMAYQTSWMEGAYRELAAELGLADDVEFLGLLPPPELAALYRRASVLVLPTHAEALPSVVIEALLTGTPVVASWVGGIPEQVGDYGALVQPGNAPELAHALDGVLGRLPELRARAGEMRAYAQARFSIAGMVERHVDLYEAVLRREKRQATSGERVMHSGLRAAIRAYWGRRTPA
jgi:glycosyltransferase involved in cell wall biosynthesis